MKKITHVLFWLLLSQLFLRAQVNLKIVDQEDQAPLPAALILNTEGKGVTTSNLFGIASLDEELIGQTIQITYLGYETLEIQAPAKDSTLTMKRAKQGMEEVIVSATRVGQKGVFAAENFHKSKINENNLGQDLPYLLNQATSVVTSSDAGNGVGYTGIRVRGSDPTRINVTINGIPVNDAESQGVYWVDLPDLASSTNSIQLQRGLGTSTNGAGAFGASINLQTDVLQPKAYLQASASAGSFETSKMTFKAGTGLIDDIWTADFRISRLKSAGYIDRASSDLGSVYVSAAAYLKKDVIKFLAISGKEKTYQAWNGLYEGDLETNRTYNSAGEYTDEEGNTLYYKDETDNYWQDNYQLHWAHKVNSDLDFNVALHYTAGKGYYEQYRQDDDMVNYGLSPIALGGELIEQTDLIRRRWLDNGFGGLVFSLNYRPISAGTITFGGALNRYDGDHFGRVVWARYASNSSIDHEYYADNAIKDDASMYVKWVYDFNKRLSGYLDLQYRNVKYSFTGFNSRLEEVDQLARFNFFNPKAGIFYRYAENGDLFVSVSRGSKEPNRNDFTENSENTRPKAEQLTDFEAGWNLQQRAFQLRVTAYHMLYKDQLILSGKINDVGEYGRVNVDKSFRTGLEIEGGFHLLKNLSLTANLTLSQNKIAAFSEFIDDYDADYNYLGQLETKHSKTDISFSPAVIAGGILTYKPSERLGLEWQSKYVGKQYLDNTMASDRILSAYHVANFRVFGNVPFLKSKLVSWNLLLNNVFNAKYSSNGYTYGYRVAGAREDYNFVYPQAGINFLAGLTIDI